MSPAVSADRPAAAGSKEVVTRGKRFIVLASNKANAGLLSLTKPPAA
jgi:hypothetical protein